MTNETVEFLKNKMPSVFLATRLDELSDGLINWSTIQNERSLLKRQNESSKLDGAFTYRGKRKIFINRDKFLDWWGERLEQPMF